jgi:hypothetical protein
MHLLDDKVCVDVWPRRLFVSLVKYILTPFTMRTRAPSDNVSVSFVRSLSSDFGDQMG